MEWKMVFEVVTDVAIWLAVWMGAFGFMCLCSRKLMEWCKRKPVEGRAYMWTGRARRE